MRISDWSSDVCSSDLDMLHLCSLPDGFPLSGLDTRSGGRPASGGDHRARGGASQFTAPVPGWPRLPRRATPMAFGRSEEQTSELQSLISISYAVFCLKNTHYNSITATTNSRSQYFMQQLKNS